jgi:hypothetical protein
MRTIHEQNSHQYPTGSEWYASMSFNHLEEYTLANYYTKTLQSETKFSANTM